MTKIKSIAFAISIMLLVAAPISLYFSMRNLTQIRTASDYDDLGIYTFVPDEVYPIQVENHATGRAGRNHPTKTVYVVSYRAEDGSGYQYRQEFAVETLAQNVLKEGEPIQRRVLSIPHENSYTTIDVEETVESYTLHQKMTYLVIAGASSLYLLAWISMLVIRRRKRIAAAQKDF